MLAVKTGVRQNRKKRLTQLSLRSDVKKRYLWEVLVILIKERHSAAVGAREGGEL